MMKGLGEDEHALHQAVGLTPVTCTAEVWGLGCLSVHLIQTSGHCPRG